MKRTFAFSGLMALLVACPQPQPNLSSMTVDLGYATSKSVTQPFSGTWRVADVPLWLTVSKSSGTGPLSFTVTADRNRLTPLAANKPELTDAINVTWTASNGQSSGSAVITVKVKQYTLSGAVQDPANVTAPDALAAGVLHTNPVPGESNGIIVKYRTAALRDAVLEGAGLQVQGLDAAPAAAPARQSAATLRALGVPRQATHVLTRQSVLLGIPATTRALEILKADPNVESAVPNRVLHALSTPPTRQVPSGQGLAAPVVPADQYAPLQWAFRLLGYPAVWRDMEGGKYTKPVTVAVLDTGVRFEHPDLTGKLYGPREGALDFVDLDPDPTDPGDGLATHGTHVTGIIVANWGQNTTTCAGCSPTGVVGATYRAPVKVLPLRIIGSRGTDVATVASAVEYASGLPVTFGGVTKTNPHPAQVINLSLGGPGVTAEEAAPMCDAIAAARAKGTLTFAAAGNDGTTDPYYPASCPAAVAVGSVTLSGGSAPLKAWYSNHYPKVELSAPGGAGSQGLRFNGGTLNGQPFPDEIFSTSWNYEKNQPSYQAMSGTSQATPQASALAALLLSKGVTTGAADTLARMKATATDLGAAGPDNSFGVGLINPAAALGAPAITDTLGLRLQDAQGRTFQPALSSLGQFTAYLGDGQYRVIGGQDRNGNGIYGEVNEPQQTRVATLGPQHPSVNVGVLTPR